MTVKSDGIETRKNKNKKPNVANPEVVIRERNEAGFDDSGGRCPKKSESCHGACAISATKKAGMAYLLIFCDIDSTAITR